MSWKSSDPHKMRNNCQIRRMALRWMLQMLFNGSMISVGLCFCIKGPALLRMQFKYGTSIESMSYMFLVTSIGGILGVTTWTMLLEAFPAFRLFIFGTNVILFGISTASIPQSDSLEVLLVICVWNGFHLSAITAGANVLCLELWRGLNCGPHMHSIHLCFSLGGILAPLLSKPFIGESTIPSPMHALFSLASLPSLIIGSLLILYAFRFREQFEAFTNKETKTNNSNSKDRIHTKETNYIIALMTLFFLIHILVEASIFNYLPTMSVKSDLHLSEKEGADVLAVFMGGFSIIRALIIPLAFKVDPHRILCFNLSMVLTGSILLFNFAESSHIMLKIGYGLSGLGMGCMYANAWVWMETYVNVKYRVGSLLHLAIVISSMLSPLIMGNLIDHIPMILVYIQTVAAITSCVIFSTGTVLGSRILQKSRIIHAC